MSSYSATSSTEGLVVAQKLANIFRRLLLDGNENMRVLADQPSTRRQHGVGTSVDVRRWSVFRIQRPVLSVTCLADVRSPFRLFIPHTDS